MNYLFHLLTSCCLYSIITVGLNLVVGMAGLPSFGHAAFAAVSSYAAALTALHLGVSPWIGILIGTAVASLAGAVVGAVSLRLREDYLALATFGIGLLVASVARNWTSMTRGPLGLGNLPTLTLGPCSLGSPPAFFAVSALALLASFLFSYCVAASPFGRVLRAIREDEIAIMTYGKNTTRYKVTIFTVGAALAGLGGSLTAFYVQYISPDTFTVMDSVLLVLMVILGGMGSLGGPLLGAFVLVLAPEILRFVGLPAGIAPWARQLIYGALLVALMLRRPQGVLGRVSSGPVR